MQIFEFLLRNSECSKVYACGRQIGGALQTLLLHGSGSCIYVFINTKSIQAGKSSAINKNFLVILENLLSIYVEDPVLII
jgi:hypothetical protein